MGMWPFRRKNNPRISRGGADIPPSEDDTMHDAGTQRDPGRHNTAEITSSEPERRRSRRDSQRNGKSSRDPKKLQRDPERRRTYSFSPGRNDNILIARDLNRPPVPPLPTTMKKGKTARADAQTPEASSAGRNPFRSSAQTPESAQDWQRVPTLHKRSAQDLTRRKSSKKRKEEHDREAEIKAMTAFIPTRPAADSYTTGRLMKRESKRMHEGLNRNLQNPSSDISLPQAESFHSSLSSRSEQHQTSYKLSAFDMLAPRPTIRYSENPRYGPGATGVGDPDRSGSRKRKISERVPIPEETLKANKRIDDLADDLDAGELRELMERDQKRREKKKLAAKIKMEQRIARRQEKQTEDEESAARNGTPPPPNMERGVLGREVIGLGIGTSAVVTSSKRRASTSSDGDRGKRPADAFREGSTMNTADQFKGASLTPEQLNPGPEHSDTAMEMAQGESGGKANNSSPSLPRDHAPGASNNPQMMEKAKAGKADARVPVPRMSEAVRQSSEDNNRVSQSWTSFFRRSRTTKRSSTPASFSNTTRDSIQNGQGPLPQMGYTPVRAASNIPKRTMSKFREDLPELPISPPDSRVQSPEGDIVPPIRTDYPDKRNSNRASSDDPRVRYDTPTSGYRSLDTARLRDETPTSGHRSVDAPSPEPTVVFSQSLASIDSEGSWLSGRKGGSKRGSAQLPAHPLRESTSSLQKRYKDDSDSADELGIGEDEYFTRLTPAPEAQRRILRRSESAGNPVPSSDEEDGGSIASPVPSERAKWGAVVRHPTVIHHEPHAKSREGLMNYYEMDSSEPAGETPPDLNRRTYGFSKDLIEEAEPSVHRASSVDLGSGHARRISAGSARLLDVKPRVSVDGKRLSLGEDRG